MSDSKKSQHFEDSPTWLRRAFEIGRKVLRLEDEVPVSRPIRSWEMGDFLDFSIRPEGRPPEDVLDSLEHIASMSPRTNSRRFFNQLYGGRETVAAAAEIVSTLLNSSMYTHKIAGVNADIEDHLLQKIGSLTGFENSDGSMCPGGSISNLLSVVLARDCFQKKHNVTNPPGGAYIIYTSELCHYSIRKNAGITGIGRHNCRKIATDDRGRMCPKALEVAIQEDVDAGRTPLMINATSGTTVLGAFDPLVDLAKISKKFGIWLHVDGALGGAMIFSTQHKHYLEGLADADSFSWNAHKVMGVPLTCSALIVKERGALEESLAEQADYLFQSDERSMDLGVKSIQCGRRNDSLKLWAAWSHNGDLGFGQRVDHLVEMARFTEQQVEAEDDLEMVAKPESINVCFRHKRAPAAWICKELEERQLALVGHALVQGEEIIRVPFVNPDLEQADLKELIRSIVLVGKEWTEDS